LYHTFCRPAGSQGTLLGVPCTTETVRGAHRLAWRAQIPPRRVAGWGHDGPARRPAVHGQR